MVLWKSECDTTLYEVHTDARMQQWNMMNVNVTEILFADDMVLVAK